MVDVGNHGKNIECAVPEVMERCNGEKKKKTHLEDISPWWLHAWNVSSKQLVVFWSKKGWDLQDENRNIREGRTQWCFECAGCSYGLCKADEYVIQVSLFQSKIIYYFYSFAGVFFICQFFHSFHLHKSRNWA